MAFPNKESTWVSGSADSTGRQGRKLKPWRRPKKRSFLRLRRFRRLCCKHPRLYAGWKELQIWTGLDEVECLGIRLLGRNIQEQGIGSLNPENASRNPFVSIWSLSVCALTESGSMEEIDLEINNSSIKSSSLLWVHAPSPSCCSANAIASHGRDCCYPLGFCCYHCW